MGILTFFRRLTHGIVWNIWLKSNRDILDEFTPFFDENWYRSAYPDVHAAGMDPLEHYVHYGAEEKPRAKSVF